MREQKAEKTVVDKRPYPRIKAYFAVEYNLIGSVKETHLCGGDCRFDSYSINAVVT